MIEAVGEDMDESAIAGAVEVAAAAGGERGNGRPRRV